MTTYTWPNTRPWAASAFEMRVIPNSLVFTSPFNKSTQAVDLYGERWAIRMDLTAGNNVQQGAAFEAFFDRLRGPVNLIAMWNQRRPIPLGTLQDGAGNAQWKTNAAANATWQTSVPAAATWSYSNPTMYAAAQNAGTITICRNPGTTVFAGDQVGAGAQLFRAMADATADSAGKLTIEVLPRVRTALPNGTTVLCTRPTANFILKAEGVPVVWRPGMFEGLSLDLIESF